MLTPPLDGDGKVRLKELVSSFDTDRDAVAKVGDDGDKVRRALANIPVLTICDDHEVTDDWFITGAWRARVLGNTLGRSMIRNALVAYVLFQGWGNTPERFAQAGTPEEHFLSLVPQWFAGGGTVPDPDISHQLDTLLGPGRPDRRQRRRQPEPGRRRDPDRLQPPPRHRRLADRRAGHPHPPRVRHAQRAAGPARAGDRSTTSCRSPSPTTCPR